MFLAQHRFEAKNKKYILKDNNTFKASTKKYIILVTQELT